MDTEGTEMRDQEREWRALADALTYSLSQTEETTVEYGDVQRIAQDTVEWLNEYGMGVGRTGWANAERVRLNGRVFGDDVTVTVDEESGELEAFVIVTEPEFQEAYLHLGPDVARALVHGLIDALTQHPDRAVRERAMLGP